MPRLAFRHQDTGRLIAEIEAASAVTIPVTGDQIYAPSATDPGVYARFRVVGRELYFDQQGILALVDLKCIELPGPPDNPPAS